MEACKGEGESQVGEPECPKLRCTGISVKPLIPGYQPRLRKVTKARGVIVPSGF